MFLSFLLVHLFVKCTTALSLSTLPNASAGQTVTVNWTRSSSDPATFFLSLRKDNGSPLPGSQVNSNGATTGQVAITIPPDSVAGRYLFEGFKDSGTVSSNSSPLAGSNAFNLDAVVLAQTSTAQTSTAQTSTSTSTSNSSSASPRPTNEPPDINTQSFSSLRSSISTISSATTTTALDTSITGLNPSLTVLLPTSTSFNPLLTEPAAVASSTSASVITPTDQIAASASSKLPTGVLAVIILGSIAVFLLLLLCSLVLLRRYNRKRRSASYFYRDMMTRQRAHTPSFSTNHLPTLDFDAPPAPQGDGEMDPEASTSTSEKKPPPDYTSTSARRPKTSSHNAALVIPPAPPGWPPLPPPAVLAAPAVPTIVTTPASPQEMLSLGTFPLPPTTVLQASTSSQPNVPGVRRSRNMAPQRRMKAVSAEILALKRKMLQLRQKGSEDSEVFSEARERVEMLEGQMRSDTDNNFV